MGAGHSTSLRPIRKSDLPLLWQWRNSDSFRNYCTGRKSKISADEFSRELDRDFEFDRHQQHIILTRSGIAVGTIYSYRMRPLDGHVHVSVFIDDAFQRRGYGISALCDFGNYLFEKFGLFKIYFESYAFNDDAVMQLRRFGVIEEGRLKGHTNHNGARHDLIIFALYPEILNAKLKRWHSLK